MNPFEQATEWSWDVVKERLNLEDEGVVWLAESFSESEDTASLKAIMDNLIDNIDDANLGLLCRKVFLAYIRPSIEERYEQAREIQADYADRAEMQQDAYYGR